MFLPYQQRWLADNAIVKIWEKSRQIGATYTQAYEDVRDCATGIVPEVWYSSADETAAASYIAYCQYWIDEFSIPCQVLDSPLAHDGDLSMFRAEFANGSKIHALTSNPKNFRSKRGKVIIDEFAFHKDAEELWNAAKPVTTWGFKIRIISSHYNVDTLFFQFVRAIQAKQLDWSLHRTTLQNAIDEGIVNKIIGKEATSEEKLEFFDKVRLECFSPATFAREYMCVPDSVSNRLFNRDELLAAVASGDCPKPFALGVDVGRFHDPTALWFLSRVGDSFVTFDVQIHTGMPLDIAERAIAEYIRTFRLSGVAIDSTGIGQGLTDRLQSQFGRIIIPYQFTQQSKELLAFRLRDYLTQGLFKLPNDPRRIASFLDVAITPSGAERVRIAAAKDAHNETDTTNADDFWAAALALHAAVSRAAPAAFLGRTRRINILT